MRDTYVFRKFLAKIGLLGYIHNMNQSLEKLLMEWPLPFLRDTDIALAMPDGAGKRYAAVNRALKKGILIKLKRGLYLIGKPYRKDSPSNYQVAHALYGPSYISFESALSYHQWIPEAVLMTRCATAKRSQEFETPLGHFQYLHVPTHLCYLGVQRIGENSEAFFIADPWKALADHYYVYKRKWEKPVDLCSDLRIEMDQMLESDLESLKALAENYPSRRVREFLHTIFTGLKHGN